MSDYTEDIIELQKDKYNDKYYIDCDYCAEAIYMDEYPKHLCNCRLLSNKNREPTIEYDEYYKKQQEHENEIKHILNGVVRERLLISDTANWRYESFEKFIQERRMETVIGCQPKGGIIDLENPCYSKLFYIWSISGSFSCDICMFDKFTFYRKLACSHKICNGCYYEWFKNNTTCPFCRVDLHSISPTVNISFP